MATASIPQLVQSEQSLVAPHAQWDGNVRLMCPRCGRIYAYDIMFNSWIIRCKFNQCRKKWALGLVVREVAHGAGLPHRMPIDMLFPAIDLEPTPWRSGDPIHKLVLSNEANPKQEFP